MSKVLPALVIIYMGNLNEHDNSKDVQVSTYLQGPYNNLNLGLMLKMKWQWSNLGNKGLGLNPKLICQIWFQP